TLTDLQVKGLFQLGTTPQLQTVILSSSDPTVAQVPSSLSLYPGQTATFAISTTPVAAPTTVRVSATYGSTVLTANLTVDQPTVGSLVLATTSLVGGSPVAATACLTGPAPAGGAPLDLGSSNTTVATVPTAGI